jgi:hypothetical protein
MKSYIIVIIILFLGFNSALSNDRFIKNVTGKKSNFDLSTFKNLKKDMSFEEVYALVGWPTRHAGFGIAYYVYELENGESVWISWLNGKTAWAFVQKPGNNKEVLFE